MSVGNVVRAPVDRRWTESVRTRKRPTEVGLYLHVVGADMERTMERTTMCFVRT